MIDLHHKSRAELERLVQDLTRQLQEKANNPAPGVESPFGWLLTALEGVGNLLPFILLVTDLKNVEVYWMSKNPQELFGRTYGDISRMGRAFFRDIIHPDDIAIVEETLHHLKKQRPDASTNRPFSGLFRVKDPTGAYEWGMVTTSVLTFTPDGDPHMALSLNHSISDQLANHGVFARDRTEQLIQENQHLRETLRRVNQLTRREREILILVAKEHTSEAIADQLNISPNTVRTHRKNLLRKLDLHNTAGLVRFAALAGLI